MTTIKPTTLTPVGTEKKQDRKDRMAQALRENLLKRKQQKRERDEITIRSSFIEDIYLTIDDAPSSHLRKKVDFLKHHGIPAVFFCRGESIAKHRDLVVYALQNGFLVGNHSYSHPYFSKIPLEECYREILETERLIEDCYQHANIQRPAKVIRFPFGDQGGNKAPQLQEFLRQHGFSSFLIAPQSIDLNWDWDTKDYKEIYKQNVSAYSALLEEYWQKTTAKTQILLLHDFDDNHGLFEATMQFLMEKNIRFLELSIST